MNVGMTRTSVKPVPFESLDSDKKSWICAQLCELCCKLLRQQLSKRSSLVCLRDVGESLRKVKFLQNDQLEVSVVGRADMNDVNVRIVEKLRGIVGPALEPTLLLCLLRRFRMASADRPKLGLNRQRVVEERQRPVRERMDLPNKAKTGNSDPQDLRHQYSSGCVPVGRHTPNTA